MAKARATSDAPRGEPLTGNAAFVSSELTRAQQEGWETWEAEREPSQLDEDLTGLLNQGYELRIMPRAQGWVAMLTDRKLESQGMPFILSGWAGTGVDALSCLLYKHLALASGDWAWFGVASSAGRVR